jgi:hypothetical protein
MKRITLYDEMIETQEYRDMRILGYVSWKQAEDKLARKLTDNEEMAVFDNRKTYSSKEIAEITGFVQIPEQPASIDHNMTSEQPEQLLE